MLVEVMENSYWQFHQLDFHTIVFLQVEPIDLETTVMINGPIVGLNPILS
jgi:hypothetical protein